MGIRDRRPYHSFLTCAVSSSDTSALGTKDRKSVYHAKNKKINLATVNRNYYFLIGLSDPDN